MFFFTMFSNIWTSRPEPQGLKKALEPVPGPKNVEKHTPVKNELKGAFRRPNAGFWRLQAPETSILKIHGSETRGNPENLNLIAGKLVETTQQSSKKIVKQLRKHVFF